MRCFAISLGNILKELDVGFALNCLYQHMNPSEYDYHNVIYCCTVPAVWSFST